MTRADILVAEDDRVYRRALCTLLEGAGHRVRAAADGRAALGLFLARRPDVVLLDVMMPQMDGFAACRAIRAHDPTACVVFLTAMDAERDELEGRGAGADDYIPKTVSDAVLLARLSSVLRRCRPPERADVFAFGDGSVDARRLCLTDAAGRAVDLSEREVALLRHLAAHPGEVFSKDFLLTRFWGVGTDCGEGAVSTAVYALRLKLGPCAKCLETVWGRGIRYRRA